MVALGLACAGGTPDQHEPDDVPVADNQPRRSKSKRGSRGGPSIGGDKPSSSQPAPAPAPTPDPGPTKPDGITDLGNQTWSVERRLVDKWEDKPSKFAAASQKGKGWKLKKVEARDAQWVGFKTGDVVQSLNGNSLGSSAESVYAYSQVKGAKKLKVKFKRDGQMRTHTFKIVN